MAGTMNPEIKAQWVEALRSGEYEQTNGYLRTDSGFCCLGVLCDLAVKAGKVEATRRDYGTYQYGAEKAALGLPSEVFEWAGLPDGNPGVDYPGAQSKKLDGFAALADLNDVDELNFRQIADLIDAQL
jgi:hypothetical protein